MSILLQGLITGGFGFLKDWWVGKQAQSKKELEIKQAEVATAQTIKLERARSAENNTTERIKQMKSSLKDEIVMFIFYTPLVASIISPFIDLYQSLKADTYTEGMLAIAASDAIGNFSAMPMWYVMIVLLMALWSWGASKEVIDRFFNLFSWKKL